MDEILSLEAMAEEFDIKVDSQFGTAKQMIEQALQLLEEM
jgi:hypothetical protein